MGLLDNIIYYPIIITLFSLVIVMYLVSECLIRKRKKEKEEQLITTYLERKNKENARIKL